MGSKKVLPEKAKRVNSSTEEGVSDKGGRGGNGVFCHGVAKLGI